MATEFRETTITFIVGALSIIIALAWRDYLSDIFQRHIRDRININNKVVSGLIYVLILTGIGIVVASALTEYQNNKDDKDKRREEKLEARASKNRDRIRRVRSVVNDQIPNQVPDRVGTSPSSNKIRQIRSITGVDDKKVLPSAISDSYHEKDNEAKIRRYNQKMSRIVLPQDVGKIVNRYDY